VYLRRSDMRALVLASTKVAVFLKLCVLAPSFAFAIELGASAPTMQLPTATDKVDLAPMPKRWLYVDFWASWCTPCKQSFPWMNELHAKYRDRGLQVVAVNVDAKRADADRFLKQLPADFLVAFDPLGETPKRFAVKAMPSAYLIDPQGRVRLIHRGFKEADRDVLMREIEALLKAS
jgi:cytochrome c biogenesis protein CcmG, thiol:disulfide interchange protein DsbE